MINIEIRATIKLDVCYSFIIIKVVGPVSKNMPRLGSHPSGTRFKKHAPIFKSGPIGTIGTSQFHTMLKADMGSNNTGELCALGEVFMWASAPHNTAMREDHLIV